MSKTATHVRRQDHLLVFVYYQNTDSYYASGVELLVTFCKYIPQTVTGFPLLTGLLGVVAAGSLTRRRRRRRR
jgi:hypothetical protein